ncbi:unnamed protein product [Nippostrongylus brasiliensis]|uniref:Hydrolase n=1 Tax=Nippostrongylus brasiliensis TaxID=27835 RepID=A0A0N4Y0T4_NIPBR|nr:unnamed protein product [Nippostrongylus brasiliensis]
MGLVALLALAARCGRVDLCSADPFERNVVDEAVLVPQLSLFSDQSWHLSWIRIPEMSKPRLLSITFQWRQLFAEIRTTADPWIMYAHADPLNLVELAQTSVTDGVWPGLSVMGLP